MWCNFGSLDFQHHRILTTLIATPRRLSFDLSKPISIKEAIFALDYIDHDFYVFRDEESNDVSVVYKRNAGGVGLIQPEQ